MKQPKLRLCRSLVICAMLIFTSFTASAVTGNVVSTVVHNSPTTTGTVYFSVTVSTGWVQGTSTLTTLQLKNLTTGTVVYTHPANSTTNYGTITGLPAGIYQFTGNASTPDTKTTMAAVSLSDYVWVGYKAEWEQSFDMETGITDYSTVRTLQTPNQAYSYAQSFNLSGTGDCWMEMSKKYANTSNDSRIYWILEPMANPSVFDPANNITYVEFKTLSGATTITLKYKTSGGTYTTKLLSSTATDKVRFMRKSGVPEVQLNNSPSTTFTWPALSGSLTVTVLAKQLGDEAVNVCASFGYPNTSYPVSTAFNATAQTGQIVNYITPLPGTVGPYRYLVNTKMLPSMSYIYKTLKDSVFGGTLDSTKFFLGNVAGKTFTHSDLLQGRYSISAFDSRGVRIYNNNACIHPVTFEAVDGIVVNGNTFTCNKLTGTAMIESYLTEEVAAAELPFYLSSAAAVQYFGLMDPAINLTATSNITYGFYVTGGTAYLIQNGVVGSTAYMIASYDELKLVKNEGVLEFWVAGSKKTTLNLPASFILKTGIVLPQWGLQAVFKPTGLKQKLIKSVIKAESGSCLGSFGKVNVVLVPFSGYQSSQQTMAGFNVTLKNAANLLQTLDAGSTSLNYTFSNLLPGTYTVTITYNWVLVSNPATIVSTVTLTQLVYLDSRISWENQNQAIYSNVNESIYRSSVIPANQFGNATTSNKTAAGSNYVDFRVNHGSGMLSWHAISWSNPSVTPVPLVPSESLMFIRMSFFGSSLNLIYKQEAASPGLVGTFATADKFRCFLDASTGIESLKKITSAGALGTQIYSRTLSGARTNATAYVSTLNRGFYDMSTNMACNNPLIYAKLERQLTGVKYKVYSNKFYFFYDEEYASTASLKYSVYDYKNTFVLSTSQQVPAHMAGAVNREYGDNRYSLDVTSLDPGSYILEVVNEKDEKLYLRFTK
jgi:hypothetical protein